MTPTGSSDARRSGNPATQAQINLTVKQQREQKKQEKLAEYQRQLARRKRSKLVWWIVGSAAAVLVVAVVVSSFVFAPRPASYTAGGSGAVIDGVQTFDNQTTHVQGTVDYPQNPPAGGPHNPVWLNCGIYDQPQQNENAVHALEHGAVWVTYDATKVSGDELAALKKLLPSTYVILSPYEGLDTPIALSAWNHQLKVDSAGDARIPAFFEEYWRNQNAPEPGALCTNGIDGPGKVK